MKNRLKAQGCVRYALMTFLLGSFFSFFAFAQTTSPRSARGPASTAASGAQQDGVGATIVTDGALVFAAADTAASVIAQLPSGQRVRVSRGTTRGVDGNFRRIRVGVRIGYILTDDVGVDGSRAAPPPPVKMGKNAQKKNVDKRKSDKQKKSDREKEHEKKKEPMYFSRFIGILVGESEFKEGITGVNSSTSLPIYGLKITGPDVLLSGPIIDFNLALHYGVPSYYDNYSETRPTGFVLFTDALLLIPVTQATDSLVYFGVGPTLVYSQVSVVNSGRLMDLKRFNVGASFSAGGAYRIEKVALRLEAKYIIEKQSYKAFQAAIQYEF